jgi:3-dehydroquinate synthetase
MYQEPFDCEKIISAIRKDKKQTDQQITAVLLTENFDLNIAHDLTADEVREAVSYFSDRLAKRL